jgi:hypothetical protein
MHLSLWQGLLYCCCLRPLLFPPRPVCAATTVPMMGKRPLSKAASGAEEVHSERCGVASTRTTAAPPRPRVIERNLRLIAMLQILIAIRDRGRGRRAVARVR